MYPHCSFSNHCFFIIYLNLTTELVVMQCCESFMQKLCILKHWMTGITVDECSVALWHLYLSTDVLFNSFSRKKGVYTRDKSKLYLKQYCETVQGIWKVKVRLLYIKMSLILNKLNLPIIFNWFRTINYLHSFLN